MFPLSPQTTLHTDDMDLAGDIIQSLANYLGIEVSIFIIENTVQTSTLKAYNFSLDGPITKILCFSGSLERALSNYVFRSKVNFGPKFSKKSWTISGWKYQNWSVSNFLNETHHLVEFFAGFLKIKKWLSSDKQNRSYSLSKIYIMLRIPCSEL